MRIAQNLIVSRNQDEVRNPRRGHHHAIGRVIVEPAGQVVSFPGDLVSDINRGSGQLRERELLPLGEPVFQAQQAKMNQLRNFERRDRTNKPLVRDVA